VVLLDVLAVIPLVVGEPEQPLLEDRIMAVPQSEGEAELLPVVGDSRQPIFAPAIGARPGLVVAEIVTGIPGLAVVLAHGAPLSLAQIRAPLLPRNVAIPRLCEAIPLGAGSVG